MRGLTNFKHLSNSFQIKCQRFLHSSTVKHTEIFANTNFKKCPFQSDENLSVREIEKKTVKSFDQIPFHKGFPIIGTKLSFILAGGDKNLMEYNVKNHQRFGPIYRERMQNRDIIFCSGPDLFNDIKANEGEFPFTIPAPAYGFFNEINPDRPIGLLHMEGEEWIKWRKFLKNYLLKLSSMTDDSFSGFEIYTDQVLKNITDKDWNNPLTWTEISTKALGAIFFGKRWELNMKRAIEDEETYFFNKDQGFVLNSQMLTISPKVAKLLKLPLWTKFSESLIYSQEKGFNWAKECMKDLINRDLTSSGPNPSVVEDGLLNLIYNDSKDNFDEEGIAKMIEDLITLGGNTISTNMMWTFYHLGRHPDVQDKIFNELNSVCGNGNNFNSSHVSKSSYLWNSLKEVRRITPVATFTMRYLYAEAIIGGYHVPPGTVAINSIYATHRDAKYFENPNSFIPERWERRKKIERDAPLFKGVTDPAASRPYGYGGRACIGKLYANHMLSLFFGKVVQKYKFECDEVRPIMRTVLVPDKPLNLKFYPRDS